MRIFLLVLSVCLAFPAQALAAGSYGYSEDNEVVGIIRYHNVSEEEKFPEIARSYNLGFTELSSANPDINPWGPGIGNTVLLPTKWILPTDRDGYDIIVGLAEMRLYRLYRSGSRSMVASYPIGVATDGFNTPLGSFKISDKLARPSWFVPDSVRRQQPELPLVVPPGDENPLGEYALRLSDTHYFIHGTNKPYGIGLRVSHGCIRLYPEDIVELYSIVQMGANVKVEYEPVKVGVRAGGLFIEVHDDYLDKVEDMHALAIDVLRKKGLLDSADEDLVRRAVDEKRGIPVMVGRVGTGMKDMVEAKAARPPEPGVPGVLTE